MDRAETFSRFSFPMPVLVRASASHGGRFTARCMGAALLIRPELTAEVTTAADQTRTRAERRTGTRTILMTSGEWACANKCGFAGTFEQVDAHERLGACALTTQAGHLGPEQRIVQMSLNQVQRQSAVLFSQVGHLQQQQHQHMQENGPKIMTAQIEALRSELDTRQKAVDHMQQRITGLTVCVCGV